VLCSSLGERYITMDINLITLQCFNVLGFAIVRGGNYYLWQNNGSSGKGQNDK
jgi:hypothetical protein